MSKIKKLFVWQDENGKIYSETAVISTDQSNSEDDSSARSLSYKALFNYWCGTRFKATWHFCEKFAEMAKANGWKLVEINLSGMEQD